MKKVIRLTESELNRIVKKVLFEQQVQKTEDSKEIDDNPPESKAEVNTTVTTSATAQDLLNPNQ
jgi:hypothetical protein